MRRILWIGVVALAALALLLFAAVKEPAPGVPSGVEEASRAGSPPGDDPTTRRATWSAPREAPARSPATGPEWSEPVEAEGGPRGGTALSRSAPSPGELTGGVAPPRDESDSESDDSNVIARTDPIAPGSSRPPSSLQTNDVPPVVTIDDAPTRAETVDPVVDEAVIEKLARDSLPENPTDTELNDRMGWARTLLSGESQEVRDRVAARAAADATD